MNILTMKPWLEQPHYTDLNDMFDKTCAEHADQYAVTYRILPKEDPVHITYRQFHRDVNALALALYKRHPESTRIAVAGENSYFWQTAYLATFRFDGTVIPIDRLLPPDELIHLVLRAKTDTLIIDANLFLKAADHLDDIRDVKRVVLMLPERVAKRDRETFDALRDRYRERFGLEYFEEVLREGAALLDAGEPPLVFPIDPEAPRMLIFTSGTTAMSKGVLLNHRSIVADIVALHGMVEFNPTTRLLSILPLNHTFENTCGLLTAISIGGHIHICDGLRYLQQNMIEYKIHMIIAVPAIFEAFYKRIHQQIKKQGKEKTVKFARKLSRGLRKIGIDVRRKLFKSILEGLGGDIYIAIAGAAPMNPEHVRFFDDIGVMILEGYGLTETSPVACGCSQRYFHPGTVGRPVPGVEIKCNGTGPDDTDEIWVRGPIVMLGYYEDPEATAEVLDGDGWLHTGDLGYVNQKNGCLVISGRSKSVIVLESGKKVFPEEVEYLIREKGLDFVKDAMVCPQKDDNDKLVLSVKFVVDKNKLQEINSLGEDVNISRRLEEVIEDVNVQLPSFKRIKTYFYSFKDLISTTTMKVKRSEEMQRLSEMKDKYNLKWRELTGKNIDEYDDIDQADDDGKAAK